MVITINQLYCPNTNANIKYRWYDEIVYVYFARLYIWSGVTKVNTVKSNPCSAKLSLGSYKHYWAIMDMHSAQNQTPLTEIWFCGLRTLWKKWLGVACCKLQNDFMVLFLLWALHTYIINQSETRICINILLEKNNGKKTV